MDVTPFELFDFIETCTYFLEISVLYKNDPYTFYIPYIMFIDNVMDKLPYESRMCVYQSFDISIQKHGIPVLKEMSQKLSAKITSLIVEKEFINNLLIAE